MTEIAMIVNDKGAIDKAVAEAKSIIADLQRDLSVQLAETYFRSGNRPGILTDTYPGPLTDKKIDVIWNARNVIQDSRNSARAEAWKARMKEA